MPVRKAIIPSLVYADAHRAIDFLGTAFGFERVMVVDGEPGQVAHAQLKLADNIVMLSSANPATRERYRVVSPGETGGLVTSGLYVTLDDPTPITHARPKLERKSWWRHTTTHMAAAATKCAIWKDISGVSEITTLGHQADVVRQFCPEVVALRSGGRAFGLRG